MLQGANVVQMAPVIHKYPKCWYCSGEAVPEEYLSGNDHPMKDDRASICKWCVRKILKGMRFVNHGNTHDAANKDPRRVDYYVATIGKNAPPSSRATCQRGINRRGRLSLDLLAKVEAFREANPKATWREIWAAVPNDSAKPASLKTRMLHIRKTYGAIIKPRAGYGQGLY